MSEGRAPASASVRLDISPVADLHLLMCSPISKTKINIIRLSSSDSKAVFSGERSYNNVTLIGRVGLAPVVRGSDAKPVTLFQLATSESFRGSDGEYMQRTQWHRISVFRPGLRDIAASILDKGDKVFVTGQLQYSSFKDKVTGQTIYSSSIIADNLIKLNGKAASDHHVNENTPDTISNDTMDYESIK